MKNFISMFLMTSLLLGGMTFTISKMSVCAASKNRIAAAQEKQTQLFGGTRNSLAKPIPVLPLLWIILSTAMSITAVN